MACQCWGPRPLENPFHLPESAHKRRVEPSRGVELVDLQVYLRSGELETLKSDVICHIETIDCPLDLYTSLRQ